MFSQQGVTVSPTVMLFLFHFLSVLLHQLLCTITDTSIKIPFYSTCHQSILCFPHLLSLKKKKGGGGAQGEGPTHPWHYLFTFWVRLNFHHQRGGKAISLAVSLSYFLQQKKKKKYFVQEPFILIKKIIMAVSQWSQELPRLGPGPSGVIGVFC